MKKLSDIKRKEIKYANKDFPEIRQSLINFAKNYFPDVYSDFNESSPAMMFIEMTSYVGDVLNFYADVQLQESFLYNVQEKINLYNLAQGMGYKPNTLIPSQVEIDVFQLVPSIGEGDETRPDFRYSLVIEENAVFKTSGLDQIRFRTVDPVDFSFSSSFDPTEVSIYSTLDDGTIDFYLLKKKVKAVQGDVRTATYEFGDPKLHDKILINDENVSEIISITDSDGETWYEVDYLAQDLVPNVVRNIPYNDPVLAQYRDSAPYILTYNQTEKRFVTRLRKDDRFEIQFGAGMSSESDEEIIPSPYNIALGLDYFQRAEDVSIDPLNFLYTKTYGLAPNDTTLTVKYSVSDGLSGNVRPNTITEIESISVIPPYFELEDVILEEVQNSITVNNPESSYGGMNRKSHEIIREEAMAHIAAQNRAVTKEDYLLRCYNMPAKFGSVAKAYIEQDIQRNPWNEYEMIKNPYALNLYVLSYDGNKNFVHANRAIKENLRQYLRNYRLMTDAVNIKDPYIVNIGVNYDLVTRPDYNSNEVILRCTSRLMELLGPDNMQIGEPISISRLYTELDKLEGVQSIKSIEIENLYDTNDGYSGNVYDVENSTVNNILYPSLDPMIFEIKFPKKDIKGRVVDL